MLDIMDEYRENEYAEWTLYDTNVQSYRSNMIASQSLLLAVAAIFYEKAVVLAIVICIVGLINQWYIWWRVIQSRAIISDFHKFNSLYELSIKVNNKGDVWEDGDLYLSEQTYVSNRSVRQKANNWIVAQTGNKKFKTNYRITRIKLDIILPIMFSIIWVLILWFSVISSL